MAIITETKKINELLDRGVERIIDKNSFKKRLLKGERLRIKHGIDPTAKMFHIGNAIPIRKLAKFQELGHQIVFIIGDFTAQIGDSSDKEAKRIPLTREQVEKNLKNWEKEIKRILDIDNCEYLFNSQWSGKMKFAEVLKLASNFTVAQMIERENFKKRYQKGKSIGLEEFLYPLMQGYDSVAVRADLEIGGTDQTFNMLAGRTIQSAYHQKPQAIIITKLIYGLDGQKMSKTVGNVININETPKEMYGKIMSLKDELILEYLELCTDISTKEIKDIEKVIKNKKMNPKIAKERLALEVVKIFHNEKAAFSAQKEFNRIFKEKKIPSKIITFTTSKKLYPILGLLFDIKLVQSKSEAKRLIQQGGVKVGGKIERNWQSIVKPKTGMIIQVGKRKFTKIRLLK